MISTRPITILSLFALTLMLAGCGDEADKPAKQAEPVDEYATEQINDHLLDSLQLISGEQELLLEDAGKNELEELSEADRQALIDLTIEESAKAISEDAEKMEEMLAPAEVTE